MVVTLEMNSSNFGSILRSLIHKQNNYKKPRRAVQYYLVEGDSFFVSTVEACLFPNVFP